MPGGTAPASNVIRSSTRATRCWARYWSKAQRRAMRSPSKWSSFARRARAGHGLFVAAAAALLLFAAPAGAMIMQADDQFTCVEAGGDVSPFMEAHHATVLRLIVPYRGDPNLGAQLTNECMRASFRSLDITSADRDFQA